MDERGGCRPASGYGRGARRCAADGGPTEWPSRWLARGHRGVPRALPLVVLAVQVGGCWAAAAHAGDRRGLDLLGGLLLAASALALAGLGRAPAATLGVVTAATSGYYAGGYPLGPAAVAMPIAVVSGVLRGHRRAAWVSLAAGAAGFEVVDRLVSGRWTPPWTVVTHGVWLVVVLGVAELVRGRAERIAEVRRATQETRRRRVSEERLALARELHDVLAHDVSLINVQAATALHLFDADPERARTALAAIKDASHHTLQELRATVGALRADGEAAPLAPTAGLDRLDELVEQTRALGVAVELRRGGPGRPLPPSVDLTAYRIVQEALTNVRRHAAATTATVVLDQGPDRLEVEVLDDGSGTRLPGQWREGHGLRGMRERVTALGGTFAAGPRPSGGFAVTARLPLAAVPEPAAVGR